jgi:hypothetical protein
MNFEPVTRIARALLYEGYLLYPYRPSSVKNRQRWTFGCLLPPAYPQPLSSAEGASMQTECLLLGGPRTRVEVQARFLHRIRRTVGEWTANRRRAAGYRLVDSLQIDDRLVHTWEEAVERTIPTGGLDLDDLIGQTHRCGFAFPSAHQVEPLVHSTGGEVGVLVRTQQAIEGVVEVSAEQLGEGAFKLRVRLRNLTTLANGVCLGREEALAWSLLSCHTILGVGEGKFLSLLDPPEAFREQAASCRNAGTWPVLVGQPGQCETMLSAPIILYDYPKVAPESPGDLFDGTEIDELLTLRIRTLTPGEKREMAALDAHACDLLQRSEHLKHEQLLGLHGTWRGEDAIPTLGSPDSPPARARVGATEIEPGMRVRLRPRGNADVFDLALAGKMAVVVSIEEDFENHVYLTVALDEDPGQDLGVAGKPGHRFYFRPEEVEPLPGTATLSDQ